MQTIKDVIKNSPNWRDAALDLIKHYTEHNLCFSSGEIAAELRTHRSDLMFSVLNLGEFVRDLYYNGEIEYTDDQGDVLQALQVPRITTGVGRTPAGKTVFVYGPDPVDAQSHAFEVDIPNPGVKKVGASPIKPKSGYPTAVAPATPAGALTDGSDGDGDDGSYMTTGDKLAALGNDEYQATVHTDRRLCITRSIFDRFISKCGKPLRNGDPVWIKVGSSEAVITLDEPDGDEAKSYDLSKERGRVLFVRPGTPFQPGDRYKVKVTDDGLIVDLTAALS